MKNLANIWVLALLGMYKRPDKAKKRKHKSISPKKVQTDRIVKKGFLMTVDSTGHRLKWIVFSLSALLLLQSCKVYHSNTVTVDEAVLSTKRVMVKDFNDRIFKFNTLFREDDKLYGFAKRRSVTAKLLIEQIVDGNSDNKYVKILLPNNSIKDYYLQDRTMGTILTIAIPVAIIGLLALIPIKKNKRICFDLFSGAEVPCR